MTIDPSSISEIKAELVEMKGELKNLATEVKAGDRGSEAAVKLIAQAQEYDRRQMELDRRERKEELAAIRDLTSSLDKATDQKVNAVRGSLEKQLGDHKDEDAPHNRTLGIRLTSIESELTRQAKQIAQARTAVAVLFALPAIGGVITFIVRASGG